MALDKLVDSAKLDGALTATADAIRAKTGDTAKIPWNESTGFRDAVAGIQTLPDEVEQATPSITVSSAGLITASATQTEGYVVAGTKSATKQLTTKAATTITPGTSNKTAVAKNVYTTGAITVKGDANLKAANILKGVSIFGVAGSLVGKKVATGTFTCVNNDGYLTDSPVTVSGLGFKPSFVCFFLNRELDINHDGRNYTWQSFYLETVVCAFSDGTIQRAIVPSVCETEDEETGEVSYDSEIQITDCINITMLDDGFKVSSNYSYPMLHEWSDSSYRYYAFA